MVAFQAISNKKYVTAQNLGASPLIAESSIIGAEQQFHLIRNSDDTVSLQSLANGKYVSAVNDITPLKADKTGISALEKFFMIVGSDGSIVFKANSNNKFVCTENSGNSPLRANRIDFDQGPNSWEKFSMYSSAGDKYEPFVKKIFQNFLKLKN